MRRWVCAVLATCLVLCGCSDLPQTSTPVPGTPTAPQATTAQPLSRPVLAYNNDDTLNPFATTTAVNAQLTGLLYDSLTKLDDRWMPQLSMAASAEQTDPTHLVVSLRSGLVFSDGSAVALEDVVTSFNEAKKSARYGALLANVASAKVDRKKLTVTFTLTAADPHALACLTFPVVRGATLTKEKGRAPVGSGTYALQITDGGAQLVANSRITPAPHYTEVGLRHLPGQSARHYALASGEIHFYYNDLSDGDLPGIVAAHRPVSMNAMVYMGINSARPALAKDAVRRALSKLLDRDAVCATAYSSWATPGAAPFHPNWGENTASSAPACDTSGAIALLDGAGHTAKNGTRLTLELIYSTERADRGRVAELIRSQMESGGVAVTLVPLEKEEYRKRLQKGEYDLYLGEIHLTADMSLRPLLMGGNASYGVARSGAAATAYGQYLSGTASVTDFLTAFETDMPYIPLCWRHGLAAYDRRLTTVTPTDYDPYSGFAAWQ